MTSESKPASPIPSDVGSIDAIVNALYESVCFEPGGAPDFDRLRSLFAPGGRLVPPAGEEVRALDPEEFAELSRDYIRGTELERRGFFERELARRVDRFGNIVQLFSTYESRHSVDDPEVIGRGINSIQLVTRGNRWWIVSVLWDEEREGEEIPDEYE